jgi:hypothetical protein
MERLFKLEIKAVADGGYFENIKNLSRWGFQPPR